MLQFDLWLPDLLAPISGTFYLRHGEIYLPSPVRTAESSRFHEPVWTSLLSFNPALFIDHVHSDRRLTRSTMDAVLSRPDSSRSLNTHIARKKSSFMSFKDRPPSSSDTHYGSYTPPSHT